MKVGAAFLQTFTTQVVQSVASIATGILIARGLGPTGQGHYAVIVAAVGLLSTLAAAGQFEGNVLTSAGERSLGRVLLVRSLIQGLVAASLILVLHPLWRRGLGVAGDDTIAFLVAAVLLCEALALLFRGINLGQHNVTAYNLTTLTHRIVLFAGIVTLRALHVLRLTTVLAAWLAAVSVNVAIAATWIWRRSGGTGSVALSWGAIRASWRAALLRGLRALVTIGLTLLLVRADVYMLGPMLGTPAVGQISVASALAEYLWYIPSILGSVLFAAVAASRGPDTVAKIARASRAVVTLLVPVAIVLALVGRTLVPLIYGSAYTAAGTLFVLLLPGMLAISLHLVIDSYFAGSGFPPISVLAAAGALVLKVGLNLAIVPRLGLPGAAVATSLVYFTLLTVKVIAFARQTGTGFATLLRPAWADVRDNLAAARRWVGVGVGGDT